MTYMVWHMFAHSEKHDGINSQSRWRKIGWDESTKIAGKMHQTVLGTQSLPTADPAVNPHL